MSNSNVAEFRTLALLLKDIGLRILEIRRSGNLGTKEKGGQHWDIVTAADKYSEGRLAEYVQQHYPADGVIGEEGAAVFSQSGRVWRFDPIDGTVCYERGSDFFGISAGLEEDGVSTFGIIHYPALKKTLAALKGLGVFTWEGEEFAPFSANWIRPPAETLKKALVIANIQPGKEYLFGVVRPAVKLACAFNSFVFDTLQLVEGKVDAVFHTGATPFDIAAAIVIAREAGCAVSGVESARIDFSKEKIPIVMARSELLRDELRRLLFSAIS
jgi:myo-inositol-1(or 4)-monophosphatase